MTVKISRVRKSNKVPKFPKLKGRGFANILQLIIGILLWIGLLIIFAITAWSLWFNTSLASLMGKKPNTFPWWFGVLCTIFIFPFTLFIILIAFMVKVIEGK